MNSLLLALVCVLISFSVGKTLPRKGVVYSYEPIEDVPDTFENEMAADEEVADRSFESMSPAYDEAGQFDSSEEQESYIRYDRVWRDNSQDGLRLSERDKTRRTNVGDPYFNCRMHSSRQDDGVEGIAPVQGVGDPCDSEFKILPLETSCGCYMTCFNGYRQVLGCSDGYLFDRVSLSCKPANEVNNCGSSSPGSILNPVVTSPPKTPARTPLIVYPSYPDVTQERLRCRAPFGLHPHPFDCRLFLNCDQGIPHVQRCGRGTVFSKRNLVCVYPNQEDCGYQDQSGYNHIPL